MSESKAPSVEESVQQPAQEAETLESTPEVSKETATPAVPNEPKRNKSYIERIMDLEAEIDRQRQVSFYVFNKVSEAEQTIDMFTGVVQELSRLLNGLQEQIKGILDLVDEGAELSTENVREKVTKIRSSNVKKGVDRILKEGLILEVESIEGEENMVAFSNEKLPYGYQAVKTFGEDVVKQLIGKKRGDVVDGITVLNIYKVKEESSNQATPNEGQ